MAVIVTGDLHLDSRHDHLYRWTVFDYLSSVSRINYAKSIIIAGDVTDVKDHHTNKFVDRLMGAFGQLASDSNAHIFVLKGNHDYTDSDFPLTRIFRHFGESFPVTSVCDTKMLSVPGVGRVLFIPHSRGEHKIEFTQTPDLVVCHEHFKGATTPDGFIIPGGSPVFEEISDLKCLKLSGDIHKSQRVNGVLYVGAPHPLNFGDTFVPRVWIIDNEHKLGFCKRQTTRFITVRATRISTIKKECPTAKDHVRVIADVKKLGGTDAFERFKLRVERWAGKIGMFVEVQAKVGQKKKRPHRKRRLDCLSSEAVIEAFAHAHDITQLELEDALNIMDSVD